MSSRSTKARITMLVLGHGLLAAISLALVMPVRSAEVDKYLPSDTEFVAQLNIRQVLNSPLMKNCIPGKPNGTVQESINVAQAKAGLEIVRPKQGATAILQPLELHPLASGWDFRFSMHADILEGLGVDLSKDVASLTLAGSGSVNYPPSYVAIAHGIFDATKFDAKFEEIVKKTNRPGGRPHLVKDITDLWGIRKEGGHRIYQAGQEYVGLIDKTTIIASMDSAFVLESFARADGKEKSPGVKKEIRELLKNIDGNQSLWALVSGRVLSKDLLAKELLCRLEDLPRLSMLEDAKKRNEEAKKMMAMIESASLGFTVNNDMKLTVSIASKGAEDAKQLVPYLQTHLLDQYKWFIDIFLANAPELVPLTVINAKFYAEGKTVRLKWEIREEAIKKVWKP
jgi:hypothetical protein